MHLRLNYKLPVLPILINLTGGPPGITRDTFTDSVGGETVATFRYYVFGLAQSVAEEFLERSQPLAWGLAALMRSKTGDRAEQKYRCLRAIAGAELGEKRRLMLFNIVETYIELEGEDQRRYAERLAAETDGEVETMKTTWAGKIMAEGRVKGQAEGMQKGMKRVVLRLIERRFGPLPESARQRLMSLEDPEALDRLSDQVLDARSLAELGLSA